jgi:serine protease inhibitor
MHDSSSVERTLCAATVQQRGEACANNRTGFLLYLWFKQSPPGKEGKQVTSQQAPRTRVRSLAARYNGTRSSATGAQQVSLWRAVR